MKKRRILLAVFVLALGLCCTGCQRASAATLTEAQIEQMRTEYPLWKNSGLADMEYRYQTFAELPNAEVTPTVIRATITGDWKTETVRAELIPGRSADVTGYFLPVRVNETIWKGDGYGGEKELNLFFGSDMVFSPDPEMFQTRRELVLLVFEPDAETPYTTPNQYTANVDHMLYVTEDGALINAGYAPYMNEANGMSLDGFRALVKQTFGK